MKNRKITFSLVLAGSLLALPAAFAGDHTSAAAKFKAMDTNNDGLVSRAEHVAGASAMFVKMDNNHDGIVTAAEMDAAHPSKSDTPGVAAWVTEKVKMIDTNGDGMISAAEHAAGSEKMFAKIDTDNDGSVNSDECDAGHKKMQHKDK